MRILGAIDQILLAQRGHLFPWAPVFLALGIGLYFALRIEVASSVYLALAGAGGICGWAAWRFGSGWSALAWALALVATGFCLAGWRAHDVAAPVLGWRYYGPVEGRVVALDRSASDALRVTLDQVRLDGVPRNRVPGRVRLSLHGPPATLRAGQRIMTTAHLSPPQGPVEPGGFDFRRHAWFQGLGAVGYTRVPVLSVAPPEADGVGLRIFALRMAVSARVLEVLPGDLGGFAAALTTGDRSAMGQGALDALRASNLAHLLAISGLHMGLLAGFVFAAQRIALSLIPALALRVPVKKIAALGALVTAAGYLALSGGNVATERAFVMVAVALGAVLVDRRAFSLRAVALAALIVLVLNPEALLGPGFQMSFAATTALVAVFGWLRDAELPQASGWIKPVLGVVISSAVAGLATAPVGAAHFNTVSHYGLLANLVSVPLMGVLVIPAAVLAALLAPIGAEAVALTIMGWGLRWILGVAHWVAALPGAQGHVIAPPASVLPVLALGALWLILWQGRARMVGLVAMLAAVVMWSGAERPAVLIADSGALIGVMTGQGRALSKPHGAGFVADNWLASDGDGAGQPDAAARWPDQAGVPRMIQLGEMKIIHVIGTKAAAAFDGCEAGALVVASVPLAHPGGCDIYDPPRLARTGSLALTKDGMVTAQDITGDRLWNRPRQRGQ